MAFRKRHFVAGIPVLCTAAAWVWCRLWTRLDIQNQCLLRKNKRFSSNIIYVIHFWQNGAGAWFTTRPVRVRTPQPVWPVRGSYDHIDHSKHIPFVDTTFHVCV